MEKNLKEKLLFLKSNCSAYEINEYFATEFADDFDEFGKEKDNVRILNYLNDEFIDIDIDYSQTKEFASKVKEVVDEAINMLN